MYYRGLTFWLKVTFAPEKTLRIGARSDRRSALCPVSELHTASGNLPEVTQHKLQQFFRFAEFRNLRFRIDEMRFLREQPHSFTLHILSALFSSLHTGIHDALKRQQRLPDDVNLRIDELHQSSGAKAPLTHLKGTHGH
jgi:hypothetical protein